MITGIIVALSEELTTLTRKKIAKGNVAYLSDRLWLINSGAGAENARNAAELLLKQGATRLISWGCAAGLAKELKPGDLVLANQCIAADRSIVQTDKPWRDYALNLLAVQAPIVKALAESDSVISTSAEKLKLAHATNAVALDMESAAVARVAQAKAVPFLVIRAIADPLDMDLPNAVICSIDGDGQVSLRKLAAYLIRHPDELPALMRLGSYFKAAKNTLKQVASVLDKLAEFDKP